MIGIYNLRNIYNESLRFLFGFSDWCWLLLKVFHRGSSQVDSLVSVLKKNSQLCWALQCLSQGHGRRLFMPLSQGEGRPCSPWNSLAICVSKYDTWCIYMRVRMLFPFDQMPQRLFVIPQSTHDKSTSNKSTETRIHH